ncbi:hypothetical protein F4821DRAFT_233968 [Hypoxylon rubiginosum]|uniref:Uncharacterized protein n=1 Tax=Hypoxylon rubiginosum TaxID=110542 RepID=A0ACC0D732_9PEZI|nr:hypothetical protein F4821DRAFT_233968 [Hypoxylon rubiginosum]
MDTMDSTLDNTTLSTISLLEARLLRVEHLLFGHTVQQPKVPAIRSMQELERRFGTLLQRVRVYGELLKLYKSQPTFFQPPPASEPPSKLPLESLRAIVLAAASSYPATASALTAISDTPVPDPAHTASLASLLPRMKGIEATQMAQAAEIAELRARSEAVVRHWYERDVMGYSGFVAGVEGRVEMAERTVRQLEKLRSEV